MTSANLQNWYYVELTLKTKAAGTSSTVNLINRAPLNATVGSYWPILKSISSVGSRMGEYLPQTFTGSIVLDNRPGTFGYERRFADILERNTIIDQSVKIYSAHVPTDTDPYSSWALAYTARAASWSLSEDGETLSISIDSQTIAKRVVTKVINSREFTTAPNGSLGQALPIVFGTNVECRGYPISASGSTTMDWAYATSLLNTYKPGGVQTYYVKDSRGVYQSVASVAATATPFDSQTTFNTQLYVQCGSVTTQCYELLTVVDSDFSSTHYLLTQLSFLGDSVGVTGTLPAGYLVGRLYEFDTTTLQPTKLLAEMTRTASDFLTAHQAAAGTSYEMIFQLPEPILLTRNVGYAISLAQVSDTAQATSTTVWIKWRMRSGASYVTKYKPFGNNSGTGFDGQFSNSAVSYEGNYNLYGVKFTDTTAAYPTLGIVEDGLSYAYIEATQQGAPSGLLKSDLSKLDLILSINGLLDDSSGTVTGSASSQITSPQHAIELLDKEWNGSAWTGGRLDNSKFSATHAAVNTTTHVYYRALAGRTEGRTFLADLYNEICYNTGSRIALVNSSTNPLATWVWGTETASSATITDEDGVIIDVRQAGVETIINRLQMYYDKRLKDVDFTTGSAEGQNKAYAKQIDWTSTTNAFTTALAAISKTIYGFRELTKTTFDWLNATASGETMAGFFLRRFANPNWFVTLEVPYIKYKTLDLMDVITIVHPDLPAYFGTSANSKRPTYSGAKVDVAQGFYPKRANSYRAQIESRELNLFDQQFPRMTLITRILDNYPTDPT